MRSKKLSRQLRKAFDREDVEAEINRLVSAADPPVADARVMQQVLARFPEFLEVIERAYEQSEQSLVQARRSLDISGQEVEARNRELRLQNRRISDLLHNLRLAVFTVDAEGIIDGPVSRYSQDIFQRDIVGLSARDVVYADYSPTSELRVGIESVFATVFSEPPLQWEVLQHLLPERLTIRQGEQKLRISYIPIWDDTDCLSRIVFVVEDTTRIEALSLKIQEEQSKAERSLTIIKEFLRHERDPLINFMRNQASLIQGIEDVIQRAPDQHRSDLKIQLHTLKGNTRMYGFSLLARTCHTAETLLSQARSDEEIRQALEPTLLEFEEYKDLAEKLFGTRIQAKLIEEEGYFISVPRGALRHVLQLVHELKAYMPTFLADDLERAMEKLSFIPLASKFATLIVSTADLARSVGKEVEVKAEGDDSSVPARSMEPLYNAIVQLLRNAVDHGLGSPEQRQLFGKSPKGRLQIRWSTLDNGYLEIRISDDGFGFNTDALVQGARARGLLTAEQAARLDHAAKLELAFLPELSTKQKVSETSGRGLGLNIVRQNIAKLGGELRLESAAGYGSTFTIYLPPQANPTPREPSLPATRKSG